MTAGVTGARSGIESAIARALNAVTEPTIGLRNFMPTKKPQ